MNWWHEWIETNQEAVGWGDFSTQVILYQLAPTELLKYTERSYDAQDGLKCVQYKLAWR